MASCRSRLGDTASGGLCLVRVVRSGRPRRSWMRRVGVVARCCRPSSMAAGRRVPRARHRSCSLCSARFVLEARRQEAEGWLRAGARCMAGRRVLDAEGAARAAGLSASWIARGRGCQGPSTPSPAAAPTSRQCRSAPAPTLAEQLERPSARVRWRRGRSHDRARAGSGQRLVERLEVSVRGRAGRRAGACSRSRATAELAGACVRGRRSLRFRASLRRRRRSSRRRREARCTSGEEAYR